MPRAGYDCASFSPKGRRTFESHPFISDERREKIEFADALGRLQELLGQELRVLLNFRGTFGAATMHDWLTRVQTRPPDHSSVNVLLDDRQGLMLDPIDSVVLLVEDECGGRQWLEFHLPSGGVASIEFLFTESVTVGPQRSPPALAVVDPFRGFASFNEAESLPLTQMSTGSN